MKIKSLKYHDKSRNWNLETTTFGNLTLLVGASGVGKTQILHSIQGIQEIANGESLSGVEWNIEFQLSDSKSFVWQGEFENYENKEKVILPKLGSSESQFSMLETIKKYYYKNQDKPKILWERLTQNGNPIVEREGQNIDFNKARTVVKFPQEESIIHTLRAEEQIAIIKQSFRLVFLKDYTAIANSLPDVQNIDDLSKKYNSIEEIRNSDENIRVKLYLCAVNAPKVFEIIKKSFIDIFPFVKDVKIVLMERGDLARFFFGEAPFLQILEKGVQDWIDDFQISLGMQRTLLQISDLYLSKDGTVFLIDEFENSLGVNCIDDLTSILLNHKRDLQFILTSHHPYIINKINYNNWKIVTRQGGVVKTHDASEFDLGRSKHEAFTQLINLDEYTEGIEV